MRILLHAARYSYTMYTAHQMFENIRSDNNDQSGGECVIPGLEFDSRKTEQRIKDLQIYFNSQVLDGDRFICEYYQQCRNSHPGTFYEGQLHYKERYRLERLYELWEDIMDGNKRYRNILTQDMIKELDYFIDVSKEYLEID